MSYPYDSSYTPSLPALEVVLRRPEGNSLGPLPALIDTGADTTLIPLASLQRLGLRPFSTGFLRSQWGERHPVELYLLDIQVADQTLPDIEAVSDGAGRELILGRNVLNKLLLFLDGPSQMTDVLVSRPRIGR